VTIHEKLIILDKELQEMNLPFDKGLPILQDKLWKIAEEHNTTGADIFMQYMNWKALEIQKQPKED